MTLSARITAAAMLISCMVAVSGAQSGSSPDSPPEQITTDTLAYCRELAVRLEKMTGSAALIPATVLRLSTAGRDMCEQGLTRGGIMRLRKAIVLMMHPDMDTDPGPASSR
ncbi:MAG: hypothetical protein JSR21_10885 [Proteobacteria bacterium]|nr:hypothetical protein [Pseudomonadota bacterium]